MKLWPCWYARWLFLTGLVELAPGLTPLVPPTLFVQPLEAMAVLDLHHLFLILKSRFEQSNAPSQRLNFQSTDDATTGLIFIATDRCWDI